MIRSKTKPYAVCAVNINNEGKILSVSRKNNHNDFGLPGGKIDLNETSEEAIVREVLEETGYHIEIIELLYSGIVIGKVADTFLCKIISPIKEEISEEETGIVKFVNPKILINKKTSSFYKYNRKVISKIIWKSIPNYIRYFLFWLLLLSTSVFIGYSFGTFATFVKPNFESKIVAILVTLLYTFLATYESLKENKFLNNDSVYKKVTQNLWK